MSYSYILLKPLKTFETANITQQKSACPIRSFVLWEEDYKTYTENIAAILWLSR